MNINRRAFLGVAGAVVLSGARKPQFQRLACNSWPFRGYFDTPQMHRYRDSKYPLLSQAEFPQFLADHFGIHNVEFLPQHFVDTDPGTIAKIKEGLKKANSGCCNLMGVQVAGGVFVNNANRQTIVQEAERWTKVASALGSPSITIALTGRGRVDAHTASGNLAPATDAIRRKGIKVLFHNDDMQRENADILTSVIQELGRDRTGTCPDFGNFATKSADFALEQLRALASYASNICHAKDGIAENGKFYADNFPASMKVMHDAGFRGVYSIEFEGLGEPLEGVRKLRDLTEEYLLRAAR
ncbi:MAG TPA: TIM barrel protein [Bryobacteraceae bacterium]|nr:TIM barrel protein [Bryobacteraceae bacterium]